MTRAGKQLRLINQAIEPRVRLWRAVLDKDVRARRHEAAIRHPGDPRDWPSLFDPASEDFRIICAAAAVDPDDAWHTLTGDI